MAIRIQHSPSPALMGQVAYAAGAGQEATRRGESNREFNLRNQQARFQNEFNLQQAALREKARREQQRIQIQQQMFDQQRQRAEYGRSLQNDAFGQQRDRAIFNRNLANDAFDRSYKQAMFGQNQQRYDAIQEQAEYARKAPFLANMNKALMERIDNIREQYDDAQWKTTQAKNEYIGLMQQLPGIMGQDAPTETANKLLSDFIQTFDNKGFQNKVAPPLSQTELHERDTTPLYGDEVDPITKEKIEIGRTWVENGTRKYSYRPSSGSASRRGSSDFDYSFDDLAKRQREIFDMSQTTDNPLTMEQAREAARADFERFRREKSQQPTDAMSASGQGEGEQHPQMRADQAAAMQEKQARQAARQQVVDSGVSLEQLKRIESKSPQAAQALLEVPKEERPAAARLMQQAVIRGEQLGLPGNKIFSRREILDMVENSPEDVPLVWTEKETMTTKSVENSLPQGGRAKVMEAKKSKAGMPLSGDAVTDQYGRYYLRPSSENLTSGVAPYGGWQVSGFNQDEALETSRKPDRPNVTLPSGQNFELKGNRFANMVRLVQSGELNDEQAIEIMDDLKDKGLITEKQAASMIDQHNVNQSKREQDESAELLAKEQIKKAAKQKSDDAKNQINAAQAEEKAKPMKGLQAIEKSKIETMLSRIVDGNIVDVDAQMFLDSLVEQGKMKPAESRDYMKKLYSAREKIEFNRLMADIDSGSVSDEDAKTFLSNAVAENKLTKQEADVHMSKHEAAHKKRDLEEKIKRSDEVQFNKRLSDIAGGYLEDDQVTDFLKKAVRKGLMTEEAAISYIEKSKASKERKEQRFQKFKKERQGN